MAFLAVPNGVPYCQKYDDFTPDRAWRGHPLLSGPPRRVRIILNV